MQTVRFVFGAHIHQPVGNFDHVFAQHVRDVYRPFLAALAERDFFPIALHISGPLLEWLERHDDGYLDMVGRLAADGKLELLLSGFYEPILASLPRRDRVEQIEWMREALVRRFGLDANGLWLTERVWEPELAADLAAARVEYVLVDDRHFLVTGFERERLHWPFRTESDCRAVTLLPIDERLRYLIPFQPPADSAAYLRSLRERDLPLAVFADDGEKFGGWPGTREWVYDRGWLSQFLDAVQELIGRGEVCLVTPARAVREVETGGLAYLPTASYREMEEWSLPPHMQLRMQELGAELGEERMRGADGALVRGAHWRNFLVRYPEGNRMHKKMCRLSHLCRDRGDPADARREIGRAQCNDAYWHGVFGGLYLPHLRDAVWRHLARAEAHLRQGERLAWEIFDVDGDGHAEIWVHSNRFSALVSPRRGGAVEEYTVFDVQANYANVLTRTVEAYHSAPPGHGAAPDGPGHRGLAPQELPPKDLNPRAVLQERVVAGYVTEEAYASAAYEPLASWAAAAFDAETAGDDQQVVIRLVPVGSPELLTKELTLDREGHLTVRYAWSGAAFPADAWFTTELSLARPVALACEPPEQLWSYAITTVAKSERGLEETVQGLSITLRWPAGLGGATVQVNPYGSG